MHFHKSWLLAVLVALLLLLQQQSPCDAAATTAPAAAAPPKTVEIQEPSAPAGEAAAVKQEERKSVKKALNADEAPASAPAAPAAAAAPKDSMVVVEKGGPQAVKVPGSESSILPAEGEDVHIEHSRLATDMEMDFPGQAVVYFIAGITSSAILFLVLRVYRLRLSRAERKYGVQGDRANQELTPLPMAIEDVNSDEEDHTLFEVNRQNIRIL